MLLLCTYLHGKVALARVALFASCRLRLLLQYDFFEKKEILRCLVNVSMSYAFHKCWIWGVFLVHSLGWFDKTPWIALLKVGWNGKTWMPTLTDFTTGHNQCHTWYKHTNQCSHTHTGTDTLTKTHQHQVNSSIYYHNQYEWYLLLVGWDIYQNVDR